MGGRDIEIACDIEGKARDLVIVDALEGEVDGPQHGAGAGQFDHIVALVRTVPDVAGDRIDGEAGLPGVERQREA